ncbi:hypothetical protein L218DRAFT_950377 [Marasmius fiardii PR-910]|nr:hypothetical protein L218DRAFT_950377 [Marasmius fiardii PR-910]
MIFALLDLLLFTLSSKTAISFVFDFSVSKLYTNAVLSSLNARTGWNHLNNVDDDNILFSTSKAMPGTEDIHTDEVVIDVNTKVHPNHESTVVVQATAKAPLV